jgi:hypothetical protein
MYADYRDEAEQVYEREHDHENSLFLRVFFLPRIGA